MAECPTEAWLRSEDPEKFAEAAILCQHAGGFCIQDGYCHYAGCFTTERQGWSKAARAIEQICMKVEDAKVAKCLSAAVRFCRQNALQQNKP